MCMPPQGCIDTFAWSDCIVSVPKMNPSTATCLLISHNMYTCIPGTCMHTDISGMSQISPNGLIGPLKLDEVSHESALLHSLITATIIHPGRGYWGEGPWIMTCSCNVQQCLGRPDKKEVYLIQSLIALLWQLHPDVSLRVSKPTCISIHKLKGQALVRQL
jgi:hypothetical protein